MNESVARAAIKTILEGVANIGQVYDYERYAKQWTALRSLFMADIGGTQRLRGWVITLTAVRQEPDTFMGGTHVYYDFLIRGFEAVDDSSASEKTFKDLALAVIQALDGDTNLNSNDYEGGAAGRFVSQPCDADFDYRMFAGVLCHFVEIRKTVEEII